MFVNKRIIIVVAAGLTLGVSSCRKYLDVNTNPNIATTGTVATLLPAGELNIGTALGNDMQVNGSIWGGYWTQSPNASQYKILEQYNPGQDNYSYLWDNLYTANENLYQLIKIADQQKKRHYKAIALLLQAYTFQLTTDAFGDVPFTQALKAQPADGGFLNPKYDSQMVVYSGIMKYIDSAENLILQADAAGPGADDLIYAGDMTKWTKFGYTLKLRTYLRLSKINPTLAQSGITALYATPGVEFLGIGDDAAIHYGSSTANKNPLYAEASSATIGGTQNLVASSTVVDSMNSNDDYRAYVFFTALSPNGPVAGITQGAYNVSVASNTYSIPSSYVGGDAANKASATAPVNFLTSYESYFLQAEAVARGWGATTFGDDATLFYLGDSASFDYYRSALAQETGTDGATAYSIYVNGDVANGIAPGYWATYPAAGTTTEKIRHIITAKWFAMCGNEGFEAWTEFRRTGYPDFFVKSVTSGGNGLPKRFLYPTTESVRNASYPGLAPLTAKMWWDL